MAGRDDVAEGVDQGRRRFLGSAAMTIGAAHFGVFSSSAEAKQRVPRELAAIGRATEWLNSPPLTGAA